MNKEIIEFTSLKNVLGGIIGIVWNLNKNFGSHIILKRYILPIQLIFKSCQFLIYF